MNYVNKLSIFKYPIQFSSFKSGTIIAGFGSLFLGQWFLSDIIHIPGGILGFLALGSGVIYFLKSDSSKFSEPTSVQGWTSRCNEVKSQFKTLEQESNYLINNKEREVELDKILTRNSTQRLLVTCNQNSIIPDNEKLKEYLIKDENIEIDFYSELSARTKNTQIPELVNSQDILIHSLEVLLKASDLLWVEKLSQNQRAWILVTNSSSERWENDLKDLQSQLPARWFSKIINWTDDENDCKRAFAPVRRVVSQPKININLTKQRLLSDIHSKWQSDLEILRREKFKSLQNKSQWIVASVVFASPVPSGDLLSVAVVNGLMIKEMSNIWSCNIKPELLNVVAKKLACAAIAQGVVEWSGQSLLGVAKLHGGTWLAAGSLQALSSAYLTRIVGRSMADWMALNNGVSELDVELLNKQVSLLVSNAAEKEKVNWLGFLKQASDWIDHKGGEKNFINNFSKA